MAKLIEENFAVERNVPYKIEWLQKHKLRIKITMNFILSLFVKSVIVGNSADILKIKDGVYFRNG